MCSVVLLWSWTVSWKAIRTEMDIPILRWGEVPLLLDRTIPIQTGLFMSICITVTLILSHLQMMILRLILQMVPIKLSLLSIMTEVEHIIHWIIWIIW